MIIMVKIGQTTNHVDDAGIESIIAVIHLNLPARDPRSLTTISTPPRRWQDKHKRDLRESRFSRNRTGLRVAISHSLGTISVPRINNRLG